MRMSESVRTTALILTALLLAAPAGAAPGRIVSLTPVGTEILFALGLGDSIAAVTEFCDTPEEARLKPKIGGFAAFGLELLLAMETDLVVMQDIHAQFAPQFEQLGIPYAMLRQSTLAEVLASIEPDALLILGDTNGLEDAVLDGHVVRETRGDAGVPQVHDQALRTLGLGIFGQGEGLEGGAVVQGDDDAGVLVVRELADLLDLREAG